MPQWGFPDISPQTANIFSNVKMVGGVVIGLLLYGEAPIVREIIGRVLILGSVIGMSQRKEIY